ncbi:outer membrane beta-barrel protein [Litorilituus lipolyticus]|nr:outer membrane beta-barrel protein [Litorilituus lipolyticus]
MSNLKTFIAAFFAFISLTSHAYNKNQFNYIGINAQHTSYDNINFIPDIDMTELPSLTYDDTTSEMGYRGYLGHQLNRYIAVEAGIISFGEANFSISEETISTDGKTTTSVKYSGAFKTFAGDIRAIGTYPINDNLYIKAQLGILAWDNEFSFLTTQDGELVLEKDSKTGTSLITGIGVAYGFNDVIAIALDYEATEIADITTKNIGLSLLVRF